jgi:gamma-glutamylaminecyclotransferase
MSARFAVFVYGTLKEGFPNFALNRGRRLPGSYRTRERYPLYLIGERCSPCLIMRPGAGFQVTGQLFLVDAAALAGMDRLERTHLADGYRRVAIGVVAASGEQSRAYAYLKPAAALEGAALRSGPLASYEPVHAARYTRRAPESVEGTRG